jgi:hypothetical protein
VKAAGQRENVNNTYCSFFLSPGQAGWSYFAGSAKIPRHLKSTTHRLTFLEKIFSPDLTAAAHLPGVIVSGLTEADIASQTPPGRADDPSRRQTALNVPIIRPMKKFLTTLTVIAATALGAQGQFVSTNTFPVGSGTNSFSGLTFGGAPLDPESDYTKAKLFFRVEGFDFGSGDVNFTGITLSGQGITNFLSFGDVTITNNSTTFAVGTGSVNLDSPVAVWDATVNTAAFTAQFRNGASALYGARIGYRLFYENSEESNFRTGNINLVAVPEPSAYAAAAGLLALFLWSSRRHLFKLAGSRSASSDAGGNGAA